MFIFGNGESRLPVDIDKIDDIKIGCNAIARDYHMDHLVCVDRRMVQESIDLGANNHSLIYTRKDWHLHFNSYKRIRVVPDLPYVGSDRWDDPFHWGSGPYAVLLGAKLCKDNDVKLLGFDLYSKDKKVNNIYKGTSNYDSPDKRAVDPRYWIHQIGMVLKYFPKIIFTVYIEDEWQLPQAWNRSNVKVDKISNIYYNT